MVLFLRRDWAGGTGPAVEALRLATGGGAAFAALVLVAGAGAAELEGALVPVWLEDFPAPSNDGGIKLNVGIAGADVAAAEVLVGAELVVCCPPRLKGEAVAADVVVGWPPSLKGEAAGCEEVGAALDLLNMFWNGEAELAVEVDGVSAGGGLLCPGGALPDALT